MNVIPLTRTTAEDALIPQLLRRRKWSRPPGYVITAALHSTARLTFLEFVGAIKSRVSDKGHSRVSPFNEVLSTGSRLYPRPRVSHGYRQ